MGILEAATSFGPVGSLGAARNSQTSSQERQEIQEVFGGTNLFDGNQLYFKKQRNGEWKQLRSVVVAPNQEEEKEVEASSSMGFPPPGFENVRPHLKPQKSHLLKKRKTVHFQELQPLARQRYSPKLFAVFVLNLPSNAHVSWLKNIFGNLYGFTKALVAHKPNSNGRWYGFVYFKDKQNLQLAIQRFNGALVEDQKLFVTQAWDRSIRSKPPLRKNIELFSQTACQEESMTFQDFHNRGSIVTSQAMMLKHSYLAVAHLNLKVDAIMKEIALQGVCKVQLKALGNNTMLVHFPDSQFEEEMLRDGGSWLQQWLTFIPGQQHLCSKGGRFVWFAIFGVPYQGWCMETFQACLSQQGQIIFTHPQSTEGLFVDIAYVLVHTYSLGSVSKEAQIYLGNESFKVWISLVDSSSVPPICSNSSASSSNSDSVDPLASPDQDRDSSQFSVIPPSEGMLLSLRDNGVVLGNLGGIGDVSGVVGGEDPPQGSTDVFIGAMVGESFTPISQQFEMDTLLPVLDPVIH